MWIPVPKVASGGDREARLAAAAGARQRHDPRGFDVAVDELDLRLPADEGRDLPGQVRGHLGRPQRTLVVGRTRDDEPEERRGFVEVLHRPQPVLDHGDVVHPGHDTDPGWQPGDDRR